MPDPTLPEPLVRDTLASYITTQPATLGELKFTVRRDSPLVIVLADCKAELILQENFYVEVPRHDRIFAPVTDRLAELERAQAQLNLVAKDFIASIGGQKSSAALSFLEHTFVRTSVPAQTHGWVPTAVTATHNGRFFGGAWKIAGQTLEVAQWPGRRLSAFKNPLPVDTPEFSKQLNAFLDSAKKTLEEVDDISNRYIAKIDEERAAIFRALPPGAVLAVKDAKDGTPLFLEVKQADAQTGLADFVLSSTYASPPARANLLRGIHPDSASELRALLENRRQPKVEPPSAPAMVEAPAPQSAPVVLELSARQALAGQTSVQLALAATGAPIVRVTSVNKQIDLQRVADEEVATQRARFRKETEALIEAAEVARVYRGTIENTVYLLGVQSKAEFARVFVLQPEADTAQVQKVAGALLAIEREHATYQLAARGAGRQPTVGAFEITGTGAELKATGRFGTVVLQPAPEQRILRSGRIVPKEQATFLEELRQQNRGGVFQRPGAAFLLIEPAPAPEAGGFFNSLGGALTGSATVQFPASAPITKLKRDMSIYTLQVGDRVARLALKKEKAGYSFEATRTNRGTYAPRAQDLAALSARELDDDIFSLNVGGGDENIFALMLSTSDGAVRDYFLVQFEP